MKPKYDKATGCWEIYDDEGSLVARHITAGHMARMYAAVLEEHQVMGEALVKIQAMAAVRRKKAALENGVCPYSDTKGEAFCYWRGMREGLTGIDAIAHDALHHDRGETA